MIGDLAAQDDYAPVDDYGRLYVSPPKPDPRESLPGWAKQADAMPYTPEPSTSQVWGGRTPRLLSDLPDVGKPTIPSGPAWPGSPTANRMSDIASNVGAAMIPSSPLDFGLMMEGGPLAKGAAALGGYMLDSDDAQAGAGRLLRDPRLWSAISDVKLRKPLDEMAHRFTDVRMPSHTVIDPASLVGGYGIFTPSDLSRADRTVTHVDDAALQRPVTAYGGVGFPEANPGMAWASEAPIARRLDNQAAALTEKTGKPVYIMPMTMSAQGIDASHHVADPLAQLVQQAPIRADDAAAFNEMMRKKLTVFNEDGSVKKAPNWVDTTSPDFQDFISNLQGGMTTKALMADRMALAEWQKKGFPDVAAVRHAMSEPDLIEAPRNTTGMAISRYLPGQGLLDTTHPSYSKGVAGEHMGQLASLLPFDVAAPTIAEGLAARNAENLAAGKKTVIQPAYHMSKPAPGVPTEQYFDQEWLDRIMKRWEDQDR